jgi:beta-galactosidase
VHFVLDETYLKWRTFSEMVEAGVTLTETDIATTIGFLFSNPIPRLEACDAAGLACKTHGVICTDAVGRNRMPDLTDPEVLRGFTNWVAHHQRRLRNHPSLFFYVMTAYVEPAYYDPTQLGRTSRLNWRSPAISIAYQVQKSMDPTRAYWVHSGPSFSEVSTGNMYFNHTPWQEVEDWLSLWSESGDRPVSGVEYCGTALSVDYLKGGRSYATEYAALHAGDRAYAEESDESVIYSGDTWLRKMRDKGSIWAYRPFTLNPLLARQTIEGDTRTTRAWRFRGVPCRSWIFNSGISSTQVAGTPEMWQTRLELIRPVLVWLGGPPERWTEKDHNYYSGERITKSALIIRDLTGSETWQISWEARLSGQEKPFAEGRFEKVAGTYARECWPFTFTAPAVTAPTAAEVSFVITANQGVTEIGRDTLAFTVFPRPAPVTSRARPGWALLDPEGDTAAWLQDLGLEVPSFQPGGKTPAVLLLGRRALRGLDKLPFTAADLERGLRVVIFEQHCAELAQLGFRMEDRCPRQAFVRQPDSPLTAGLTSNLLRDWRGDATLFSWGPKRDMDLATHWYHWSNRGNVASAILETPHLGPFWSLLDTEFDLAYSPLLVYRQGRGELVYCTLDLTGRVGVEPGATLVAQNLLRYLDTPLPGVQDQIAVCLTPETEQRVQSLGFAAQSWRSGRPEPGRNVLVVGREEEEALSMWRREIDGFARAGGKVLFLAAGPELLRDPLFQGKLKASEIQTSRAGREVDPHPLLRGVGPQQLHWREVLKMTALTSSDPQYVSLLGGLMGVLPCGRGQLIFLQTDPAALEDFTAMEALGVPAARAASLSEDPLRPELRHENRRRSRWQLIRLHSLVLANLGLRANEALISRLLTPVSEVKYSPVDHWVYLGTFPAPDHNKTSPLDLDLSAFVKLRDLNASYRNSRDETVTWYRPNDATYGLGVNGVMDFSKHYPRRTGDLVVAVTQIWSTHARQATARVGADWWLRVEVNGQEVFRSDRSIGGYGTGFRNEITLPLRAGWNDVVCTVAAGSAGHMLWFKLSDPGDVRVQQAITTPEAPPADLPSPETLREDTVEVPFCLYVEATIGDDPYLFIPW